MIPQWVRTAVVQDNSIVNEYCVAGYLDKPGIVSLLQGLRGLSQSSCIMLLVNTCLSRYVAPKP